MKMPVQSPQFRQMHTRLLAAFRRNFSSTIDNRGFWKPFFGQAAKSHPNSATFKMWCNSCSMAYFNLCRMLQSSVIPLVYRSLFNLSFANRKLLLGAVAFSFSQNGISDDDIQKSSDVAQRELELRNYQSCSKQKAETNQSGESTEHNSTDQSVIEEELGAEWTVVIEQDNFKMWRRPLPDHPYVCEYKCIGTYTDVPAAAFFIAQVDLEYRKTWDNLVIALDVIDDDKGSGSEVIRWVTHFPYPMSSREYIFVRRACINACTNTMCISTRSIEHPAAPVDSKLVRVDVYESSMVIKPHTKFHENGLDYVLTYVDDPKSGFPTPAYKWLVKYGVPGYVQNVHAAALKLHAAKKTSSNQSKTSAYESPLIYGNFGQQQQI